MEKTLKPMSGYLALVICLLLMGVSVYLFIIGVNDRIENNISYLIISIVCFCLTFFFMKGLMIIQPNHSRVFKFLWKICWFGERQRIVFYQPFVFFTEDISAFRKPSGTNFKGQ